MYSSAAFPRLRLFVTVFLVTHVPWVPAVVSGCAGSVLGNIAGGVARHPRSVGTRSDRRAESLYQFTSRHGGVTDQPRLAWAGKGGAR